MNQQAQVEDHSALRLIGLRKESILDVQSTVVLKLLYGGFRVILEYDDPSNLSEENQPVPLI
ncbi:MAG: hypothetical protein GY904_15715 [Planctomycetaceae bacterium]|nr:hypothetical protein [Planctomycetaceae bacterium]